MLKSASKRLLAEEQDSLSHGEQCGRRKVELDKMQRKLLRESFIRVAKEQVACDLAGEAVILSLKSAQYFGLNEVGARIWNLIQEPKTVGAVLDAVLEEYDITPDQLECDLLALLEQMVINDLIEVEQ